MQRSKERMEKKKQSKGDIPPEPNQVGCCSGHKLHKESALPEGRELGFPVPHRYIFGSSGSRVVRHNSETFQDLAQDLGRSRIERLQNSGFCSQQNAFLGAEATPAASAPGYSRNFPLSHWALQTSYLDLVGMMESEDGGDGR